MNNDLDVNFLVQTFTERISQLTNDNIIKDAVIKQLQAQIEQMTTKTDEDDNT